MERKARVIILLGAPGAGKGTQAERLAGLLGIPTISTGEILRNECRSGSTLGREVQGCLDSGHLVNDQLMERVIAQRLIQPDCANGYILDGFPRTAGQAHFLDRFLVGSAFSAPVVFDLAIDPQILIDRLSSRRQCPECGRAVHVTPELAKFCPVDGAELIVRNDDQPATVRQRLDVYARTTNDVVRFYQDRDYYRVDGSLAAEKLTDRLMALLERDSSHPSDDLASIALMARARVSQV